MMYKRAIYFLCDMYCMLTLSAGSDIKTNHKRQISEPIYVNSTRFQEIIEGRVSSDIIQVFLMIKIPTVNHVY